MAEPLSRSIFKLRLYNKYNIIYNILRVNLQKLTVQESWQGTQHLTSMLNASAVSSTLKF